MQQEESRKLRRVLAKAERHRPIRAAWADRAVARGWYYKAEYVSVIPLFSLPLAILISLLLFFLASSSPPKVSSITAWGLAAFFLVAPLVLVWASSVFRKAVQKRSSRILMPMSPGVPFILAHLPFCPRLLAEVRRWTEQSGDASLSAYEYDLICEAGTHMSLTAQESARMGSVWPNCDALEGLDESFYNLFPESPRFLPEDRHAESEKEDYLLRVKSLNRATGHLGLVRTCKHQEEMGRALSAANEVEGFSKGRL